MLWVTLHIWLHQPNSSESCNLSDLGQEFTWKFLQKLPSNLIFNAICQPTVTCLRSAFSIQITSRSTLVFTGLNTLVREIRWCIFWIFLLEVCCQRLSMFVLNDCMQCLGPALSLKVCWRAFGDSVSLLCFMAFLLENFPGTQRLIFLYLSCFCSLNKTFSVKCLVLYIIPIYFGLSSFKYPYISLIQVGWFFKICLVFHAFPSFELLELESGPVVLPVLVSKTTSIKSPTWKAFRKSMPNVTSTEGLSTRFSKELWTCWYFFYY